jgi:hypothetical protein
LLHCQESVGVERQAQLILLFLFGNY